MIQAIIIINTFLLLNKTAIILDQLSKKINTSIYIIRDLLCYSLFNSCEKSSICFMELSQEAFCNFGWIQNSEDFKAV